MNMRDRMLIAGISTTFIMMASTILFNEITAIWMMRILFILCLVALVAYGCFTLYGNAVAKWHQTQASITKARNSVDFELMTGSPNTILVDYRARTAKRIGTTRRVETKIEAIEEDHRDLLTLDAIIKDYPHIGVTGSTGAGKTTMMRHIIDRHMGTVHIFDPHDSLRMGPFTDDFDEFGDTLEGVLFEYETRKAMKHRTRGLDDPSNILVVVDECLEALGYIKNITSVIVNLSNGGRKYGMYLLLGSSVKTVKPFKMDGYGDLLHKNIRWIEMEKRGGKHSAKFKYDQKYFEEMENPGVFEPRRSRGRRGRSPQGGANHRDNPPYTHHQGFDNFDNRDNFEIEYSQGHEQQAQYYEPRFKDPIEKKIFNTYKRLRELGERISRNKVAMIVFNCKRANGTMTKKVAETLNQFGAKI